MPTFQWDYNEYVWPFFLSVLVALALVPYAWPRRDTPASRPFFGIVVSAGVWSLLSSLQVTVVDFPAKVFLANLRYLPIVLLPVTWFAFAAAYTGRRRWLTKRRTALLLVVPVLTLILVATNTLHGWMFTETARSLDGPVPSVARAYGGWFWVHTAYCYALVGVGAALLVLQSLYGPALYRSQTVPLLLGAAAPFLTNALFLAAPDSFAHIDFTPVAFILSGVFFTWAVYPFRRLDLGLAARAAIVESIPDAVVVLDARNRVVDLNPTARRLFGRADAGGGFSWDALGLPLPALPDASGGSRPLPPNAETGFPEIALAVDNQRRFYELRVSAVPHRLAHLPERHVVVFRDVTERRKIERERERLIAELEAKNAELERFTYTVSHDLKSPLITIKGFLGYLERDATAGRIDHLKADIDHIQAATSKMSRLLDELLELSRIGRLMNPPEEVSLTDLARDALQMVAGAINARGVEVDVAPAMPVVYGDRVRLLQVFQNLVQNAVKYIGDQAAPRLEIGTRREGLETVCFVRDNGIGIDPRYHDKIFGLFERLDAQGDGTGIGLALAKRIVEVHGGRIWVESAGPGHGSTFCFTLPAGEG